MKDLTLNQKRKILTAMVIFSAMLMVFMALAGASVAPKGITDQGYTALTTEKGKTKVFSNETLEVSWALFKDQTTGKIYYGTAKTLTGKSSNVTFTTKNVTFIKKLDAGDKYYLVLQNGTAFPGLTDEFNATMPTNSTSTTGGLFQFGNIEFGFFGTELGLITGFVIFVAIVYVAYKLGKGHREHRRKN